MGTFKQTRLSRLSTGWVNSAQSIVDKNPGDTSPDFSCINGVATGTWVQTGAQTNSSTLSVGGQLTATGGVAVGGGSNIVAISTATRAISLGAIAPLESSSVVTAALSGATRGDQLWITLDALYPVVAANRDITWNVSSSSTLGEVHVWGVNSTLTSVTPTASTVVRLTRMNFASYL